MGCSRFRAAQFRAAHFSAKLHCRRSDAVHACKLQLSCKIIILAIPKKSSLQWWLPTPTGCTAGDTCYPPPQNNNYVTNWAKEQCQYWNRYGTCRNAAEQATGVLTTSKLFVYNCNRSITPVFVTNARLITYDYRKVSQCRNMNNNNSVIMQCASFLGIWSGNLRLLHNENCCSGKNGKMLNSKNKKLSKTDRPARKLCISLMSRSYIHIHHPLPTSIFHYLTDFVVSCKLHRFCGLNVENRQYMPTPLSVDALVHFDRFRILWWTCSYQQLESSCLLSVGEKTMTFVLIQY